MNRRLITIAVGVLAVVFFGVMTRSLLDTVGGDGVAWKLGTPADLELAGRPQLVEFFHPL
jgi:hypothetical protein